MIVAVCVTTIATPVAALAATGSFSSNSASAPAVSAKNTSSGSGAKAVYGNASAGQGTTYGVYGRAASASGYGVYSAGRLGSSGQLVCSHCVTGGDINVSSLSTVPDAGKLGGEPGSYYARFVPLSALVPSDGQLHLLADVDGLQVLSQCVSLPAVGIVVQADSTADNGSINYFAVNLNSATATGSGLSTSPVPLAGASGNTQTEGTAIYRNSATDRVITINFHLYGETCELFGDVITAG